MAARCYRIVVKHELGPAHAVAFDGMRLDASDGETAIIGPVADQTQLQGILARIASLNLVLLKKFAYYPEGHPNHGAGMSGLDAYRTYGRESAEIFR